MHAGVAWLLHVANGRGASWGFEAGITIPLVLAAAIYATGLARLARRATRPRNPWPDVAFATGWLTLVVALVSPLHGLSDELFSAHMVQHELLMALAAPLIIAARPGPTMLHAFSSTMRRRIGNMLRDRRLRASWQMLVRPFDAWLLHGLAIWLWHIPMFFQATLTSEAVHALQHLSFFGSGLLFWWSIIHVRRRSAQGVALVYLFTTAVHTSVLGALMAFAHTPWYPQYAATAARWGFTPMADQQLAGLIMWIPASAAYLVAALAIARRWLADSEWSVARDERAAAAATP